MTRAARSGSLGIWPACGGEAGSRQLPRAPPCRIVAVKLMATTGEIEPGQWFAAAKAAGVGGAKGAAGEER